MTDVLCGILAGTHAAAAPQSSRSTQTLAASVQAPPRRPRVLMIADVPGWIFERHARTLQQRLADEFDIVVGYRGQEFVEHEFDLIYPLEYDLVPPQRITMPWKWVTSLRSHISWDGIPPALLSRYLAGHFQQVHVVSRRLHDLLQPHLPGVTYVTHGIDLSRFATTVRRSGAGTALTVGWAGNRASPAKGFDEYIRPIGSLPGVNLTICGYSDRSLSLDDMPGFYAGLDVYVCSSSSEGNNNALLEAAASGCAIITTDNGTVPEYLADGVAALVVPRTAAAFRDAVLRLRDDAELRARLGAAASAAVRPAWGWDARLPAYREFLQSAIAGRAAAERQLPAVASAPAHAAEVKRALAALQEALTASDRVRAFDAVERLVTLDPTNGDFRRLYREIDQVQGRRAA